MTTTNLMEASNQWATRPADQRFETLEALSAAVKSRRCRSRSVDIDLDRVAVKQNERGLLTINGTITPCEPTHWSFGQLATTAKAPAGYLRTLPTPLTVDCLTHGLRSAGRDTVKFMTIASDDGETNTLQAVTSTTYGRIWDADVVDCVSRIQERTAGRFFNPLAYGPNGPRPSGLYASDRDVFVFMIDGGSRLDIGPRAKLNRGFFVKNSEVGAATFSLTTFLFNEVCGNHIVWGATDIRELSIRHTKNGPYRFDSEAVPGLLAYANATAAPIESAVKRAQDYLLPREGNTLTLDDVAAFCNRNGKFSRAEIANAYNFAKAEEGECRTLWQLCQGFTAYARGFDWIDSRTDLETRAGQLLNVVSGN